MAEKKVQKSSTIPSELDGFKIKLDHAEVELSKQNAGEKILVKFNVNHTVDSEESPEIEEDTEGKAELGEMKSKPTFEVDIVRGKTTLSFTCSFLQGAPAEGEYGKTRNANSRNSEFITNMFLNVVDDIFGIDELTIFDGEHVEKNYAVAGDVLDGVKIRSQFYLPFVN